MFGAELKWRKEQLDSVFRSEGVAVGDFDKDGVKDVAAGSLWYAGGKQWAPQPILKEAARYDPHNYSNSFCNFVDDINGDGWDDLLVVDFPGTSTWWFENPAGQPSPEGWKKHECVPVTNNESPTYLDINGDGARELLLGFSPKTPEPDAPERTMALVFRPGKAQPGWRVFSVSEPGAPQTQRFSHGLGTGDINQDGRIDILTPEGWWEQPAQVDAGLWKFHPVKWGEACSQMYAFDFDGDGDMDVASSSAHQLGIWWHEQTTEGWKTHVISDLFSQTHALVMVDMNGDQLPDLVTGKRWWAHGPQGDVNPSEDPVVYWFELGRENGKPVWTPHLIANACGVGTQFEVQDINGDHKLDVILSNKRGVHVVTQQ